MRLDYEGTTVPCCQQAGTPRTRCAASAAAPRCSEPRPIPDPRPRKAARSDRPRGRVLASTAAPRSRWSPLLRGYGCSGTGWAAVGRSGQQRGSRRECACVRACVCVNAYACARMYARVRVYACVYTREYTRVCARESGRRVCLTSDREELRWCGEYGVDMTERVERSASSSEEYLRTQAARGKQHATYSGALRRPRRAAAMRRATEHANVRRHAAQDMCGTRRGDQRERKG
jgi:hypothetical protein